MAEVVRHGLTKKHRDHKRYSVLQIINALAEAERLGVGSKLAQYFRATRRDVDVERAYSRAQAIVAFERGGLAGREPAAAEGMAESRTWAESMNAVSGDRVHQWLPQNIQDVIRLMHDSRVMAVHDEEEHVAREAAVESAEGLSEEPCEEQDSFDDPQELEAEDVDPLMTEDATLDEGFRDPASMGPIEKKLMVAMLCELLRRPGQTAREDGATASAEPSPEGRHGEAGGEEPAEQHVVGDTRVGDNEADAALVAGERLDASATPTPAEPMAPAPPRAPAAGVVAAPLPRPSLSARAPCRARHGGARALRRPPIGASRPSRARPQVRASRPSRAPSSVGASAAVVWCSRTARTPGSRSPRGPPVYRLR